MSYSRINLIYNMEEHNILSNRCPELQNILDSSFGFRVKWGTLFVILFILLIIALSFFVSIREQQTLYAECKACQKQEHFWMSTLYVRNTNTQLKNGQEVFIQNDTLRFSGVVCSIEQTQDGTCILIHTTHPTDKAIKNNYIITYIGTSTLGEIILSSIRNLI